MPFREHEHLSAWTEEERETLQKYARDAKPYKKCDFKSYNVLIVGPCKAGKSSFRNTLKSACIGEVSYQSDAGREIFSLTQTFTITPIREKDGELVGGFRFADMPGLNDLKLDTETIAGILDGKMPQRYEFLDHIKPDLAADSIAGNKIHCIVIVLDGTTSEMMKREGPIFEALRLFRKQAREREIPVAAVLTHIDAMCPCIAKDLSLVFKCRAMQSAITSVADLLGIDAFRIFVVQNYCNIKNVKVDLKVDCLALVTLKHLLQYCREFADNWLDKHSD